MIYIYVIQSKILNQDLRTSLNKLQHISGTFSQFVGTAIILHSLSAGYQEKSECFNIITLCFYDLNA